MSPSKQVSVSFFKYLKIRFNNLIQKTRFPIVVWRHPIKKSFLLISGGFHGKGFLGMLMKGQSTINFKFI